MELNPGLSSLSFIYLLAHLVILTEPLLYATSYSKLWGYSSEQDRQNYSVLRELIPSAERQKSKIESMSAGGKA